MKKSILLSIYGGLIFALASQTVLADEIPSRTLPMSEILKIIQARGYSAIREVEFDDGLYEVEALDGKGNQIIVRMNPHTGDFIKNPIPNKYPISILEAAQKIEDAGYHTIYKIEVHGSQYEVNALDKKYKKVKLRLDASTGKIYHLE
ncbi:MULTISPECIES: PepSY domain-containing protein [Legionella]|uniref:PepSY domain-containing protein n=1 Tax=Legionella waltersii TaxID=66969 RepID=A0A0W1A1N3_9GAMM|nr:MULTISPECIES: PepSY domain-containing protein [Legionella]KTD75236.1 hypothetical protein Lwal_3277 [Legionella waltersii]MCZ4798816.1 PepSY domain-containing protein [Legionella pneumophila]SNU96061.1 Uncharacterized conserved protein [Legionella waltersii]